MARLSTHGAALHLALLQLLQRRSRMRPWQTFWTASWGWAGSRAGPPSCPPGGGRAAARLLASGQWGRRSPAAGQWGRATAWLLALGARRSLAAGCWLLGPAQPGCWLRRPRASWLPGCWPLGPAQPGCWLLAAGCWGRRSLAAGCAGHPHLPVGSADLVCSCSAQGRCGHSLHKQQPGWLPQGLQLRFYAGHAPQLACPQQTPSL